MIHGVFFGYVSIPSILRVEVINKISSTVTVNLDWKTPPGGRFRHIDRMGTSSAALSKIETAGSGGGNYAAIAAPRALEGSIIASAEPPRIGCCPSNLSYYILLEYVF